MQRRVAWITVGEREQRPALDSFAGEPAPDLRADRLDQRRARGGDHPHRGHRLGNDVPRLLDAPDQTIFEHAPAARRRVPGILVARYRILAAQRLHEDEGKRVSGWLDWCRDAPGAQPLGIEPGAEERALAGIA